MHEAKFYQNNRPGEVICRLCSHGCRIIEGKQGICGVRKNQNNRLYSLVYGRLIAAHVDPIEKKPMFHFLPASRSYSIATVGCNFFCQHCQNFEISQYPHHNHGAITGRKQPPQDVVREAQLSGCTSISYTYVEPTIFYEFAYDCAVAAHEQQLKNVFVSNGYMSPAVTRELAPLLDGINIDIKAFTDDFYKKVCRARLQPVLDTVQLMHRLGVWVEVTTLLIPGLNDSDGELRDIAAFIRGIDPGIPWHVTGFYPTFKMTDRPPTPLERLERAREIGLEQGLRFVYAGNRPGQGGENTCCPACGLELISRSGYTVIRNTLDNGCCSCGEQIEGVWNRTSPGV
jgi:pyruvate formate lyase activating enzyme